MKMRALFLILFITFFLGGIRPSFAHHFSPHEIESLTSWMKKLKELCPPEKCILVGIGRSPTPFLAYLDAQAPHLGTQIPLSGFRYVKGDELAGMRDGNLAPTKELPHPNLEDKLFRHLDRHFPSDKELNGKSVLLLDIAADEGKSLIAANTYIKKYLKSRNRSEDSVKAIVLTTNETLKFPKDIQAIKMNESDPLFQAINRTLFEDSAKYGEYKIDRDYPNPEEKRSEQPLYKPMVEVFRTFRSYFEPETLKPIAGAVERIKGDISSTTPEVSEAAALALNFMPVSEIGNLAPLGLSAPHRRTQELSLLAFFSGEGITPEDTWQSISKLSRHQVGSRLSDMLNYYAGEDRAKVMEHLSNKLLAKYEPKKSKTSDRIMYPSPQGIDNSIFFGILRSCAKFSSDSNSESVFRKLIHLNIDTGNIGENAQDWRNLIFSMLEIKEPHRTKFFSVLWNECLETNRSSMQKMITENLRSEIHNSFRPEQAQKKAEIEKLLNTLECSALDPNALVKQANIPAAACETK